jgi:hypothetical protein
MRPSAIHERERMTVAATESDRVSLAVWEVPSTVEAGAPFSIKAGATSSAGRNIGGTAIEICDTSGALVGTGKLGNSPWPGTEALSWADVSLTAPQQLGLLTLTARLGNASHRFSLMVVPPAAHRLRVAVVSEEGAAPLAGTEIRLGAHRATTNAAGEAAFAVAKGSYALHVWKSGYDAPPRQVEIAADAAIRIEAAVVPEENADRAWKG